MGGVTGEHRFPFTSVSANPPLRDTSMARDVGNLTGDPQPANRAADNDHGGTLRAPFILKE